MQTVSGERGPRSLLGRLFLLLMIVATNLPASELHLNEGNLQAPVPDDPACVIGEGMWGGGPAVDIERWTRGFQDLMVVGAGAEIVVFDISTPTAPVELGRTSITHPATSISVSPNGMMVAVTDWFDNLTLVDIQDPAEPVARGSYAWPGIQQPTGSAFDDTYLYVAVRTVGLAVLDISNPDAPAFVANSDGSVTEFVFDVVIKGDYAYLGQKDDGVQIVNISNRNTPTMAGDYAASVGAGQLTIDGNRLYVAKGGNGFDILDLSSNPKEPTFVGGFDGSTFDYEIDVLSGDRLAVADSDGVTVYDIATPATPVSMGDFSFSAYRVVALDHQVFVSHGGGGLTNRVRLVDFQTPSSPSEVGFIDFDGESRTVSVGPDHILVGNSEGGVVILDSSNPVDPFEMGRLHLDNDARRVGHVNGYGVASAGYDGVIGVFDPLDAKPSVFAEIDTGSSANDLVGDGTRLYVSTGSTNGLRIYDMSNPLIPQFLGSAVIAGTSVWQIAKSGNFVYSGHVNDTDLFVIDVTTPATPAPIGSPYTLPGGAVDIAASGTTVFVGTQLYGVRILSHDGAGGLTELADIDVSPAVTTGVSVDGDFLYITAGEFTGLLIYDISDPSDPMLVEQHNTAGEANAVDASGGVIAVAERGIGVATFGCDLVASNQAPVAVGIISDQSNDEGETIFPLSTNPNFDDPDGQALVFTASGLPPGLTITESGGVVEGELGYVSSGVYPVEITATDPYDLFATQSFIWTINEINAKPVVISAIDDRNDDEGDTINLDIHGHFSDPDGETLRFEAGGLPDGLSIDGDSGVISGTLSDDSGGGYTTLILAYDPSDAVATQTFSWTVTVINLPPAVDSNIPDQDNNEGEAVNLDINGYFSDPDGDTLRFEATDLPPGLNIDGNSGIITGMPSMVSSGNYTTQISAFDPDDEEASQSFSWTINDVNLPPVVDSNIADQDNDEGDMVNLDVHGHFSDPDGDVLRFEATDLPDGLSIDGNTGVITGKLSANSSGSHSVQIQAFDPDDAMISQSFNWTVANTIVSEIIFNDGFESP